jgi:hypothetical protein
LTQTVIPANRTTEASLKAMPRMGRWREEAEACKEAQGTIEGQRRSIAAAAADTCFHESVATYGHEFRLDIATALPLRRQNGDAENQLLPPVSLLVSLGSWDAEQQAH